MWKMFENGKLLYQGDENEILTRKFELERNKNRISESSKEIKITRPNGDIDHIFYI